MTESTADGGRGEAEVPAFLIEYFDDGALVFDTADTRMIRVNTTGAAVLRFAEEGMTDEEMVSRLCSRFEVGADGALAAVASVRQQLEGHGVRLEDLSAFKAQGTARGRR